MKKIGHVARIQRATARRALVQAKRVPWPRLAKASDEYTEWHVFALWARAIADVANRVPAVVRAEIERRAPRAYESLQPKVKSANDHGDRPGISVWDAITCWAEMNVFFAARREGWLDAVRYFSAMSLRSMKAWSHWERIDAIWRRSPPRRLPTLQEWERAVESVTRLSNVDCPAQRTLDVIQSIGELDWHNLVAYFSRFKTFSLWMELMLNAQSASTDLVSRELLSKYPAFHFTGGEIAPKEAVRILERWVISNEIPGAKSIGVPAALRFQLRYHPEHTAIHRYAHFCRGIWADGLPQRLPTLDEWKEAADRYSEAR